MAFVTDVHCKICGKTKNEVTCHDNKCHECRKAEADRLRREHLAALKGLTKKERLERIEELLYDLNPDQRLSVLESQNRRYA